MRILVIEPTPNPNIMKLTMDEALPDGVKYHFTAEAHQDAPEYLRRLLQIEGVRSVYQVTDFIALERHPKADWRRVLSAARAVSEGEGAAASVIDVPGEAFGAMRVFVQTIRGIPMQIKLIHGAEEVRVPLPPRFKQTAMKAAEVSPDFLKERTWEDKGVRYGELQQIGEELAEQIDAAYPPERLERLVERALQQQPGEEPPPEEQLTPEAVAQRLNHPDWRVRYAALDQLEPAEESLEVAVRALDDPHPSVRRLAAVYLGEIGGQQVLPHLFRALKDRTAAVRRAAGDALSDLGDPAAIGPMCEALKDPSRIVRWRAARYLYEVGDATALRALKEAQDDPEFEVALQVRLAIERIEGGKEAVGPAWQQMTRLLGDGGQEQ